MDVAVRERTNSKYGVLFERRLPMWKAAFCRIGPLEW